MISVVVNSLNEASKLDKCLESVFGWAKEIIVVDMESDDQTKDVAKKYRAKIFSHKRVNYIEPVREFAVSSAKGPWIMLLDPDETLTPNLRKELTKLVGEDQIDAVNISRLNFIFGKKIKHTNFWPDRHIRFFKKGKVEFLKTIHSYPKVIGEKIDLPAKENLALQHHSYNNFAEYLQRMKRYSTVEATNRFENGEKFSFISLIYKPTYDFLRRYLRHLGFLDGLVGLTLSLLQAYYYILVEIKLWKLSQK